MNIIKVDSHREIPVDYTGIVLWSDDTKSWYLNGKLHRTDGPAVEYPNGTKIWW